MKFSRDSLLDRKGSFTTAPLRLLRATKAGALYAIIVFEIWFILGTIRACCLPHASVRPCRHYRSPHNARGELVACRWRVDRLDVRRTVPARSLMGLIAFLVLMWPEVGLAAVLGRSLVDQFVAHGSTAGAIGLAAHVIFSYLPGHSGLAIRQALRAAKYRRSLDRQFLVCQTGKKLPVNKEKEERKSKIKKEKVRLDSRCAQDLRSWNLNRLPIAGLRLSSNLRPHRLDLLKRVI
jgi:hypothetical protein